MKNISLSTLILLLNGLFVSALSQENSVEIKEIFVPSYQANLQSVAFDGEYYFLGYAETSRGRIVAYSKEGVIQYSFVLPRNCYHPASIMYDPDYDNLLVSNGSNAKMQFWRLNKITGDSLYSWDLTWTNENGALGAFDGDYYWFHSILEYGNKIRIRQFDASERLISTNDIPWVGLPQGASAVNGYYYYMVSFPNRIIKFNPSNFGIVQSWKISDIGETQGLAYFDDEFIFGMRMHDHNKLFKVQLGEKPKIISRPDTIFALGDLFLYQLEVIPVNRLSQVKYRLLEAPVGALLDSTGGTLSYWPTQAGIFSFQVAIEEPGYGITEQAFSIRVRPVITEQSSGRDLKKNDYHIYPNPFRNSLRIEAGGITLDFRDVHIYDISGKEIRLEVRIDSSGLILQTSSLPRGIYFLRVKNVDKSVRTFPLVKM